MMQTNGNNKDGINGVRIQRTHSIPTQSQTNTTITNNYKTSNACYNNDEDSSKVASPVYPKMTSNIDQPTNSINLSNPDDTPVTVISGSGGIITPKMSPLHPSSGIVTDIDMKMGDIDIGIEEVP